MTSLVVAKFKVRFVMENIITLQLCIVPLLIGIQPFLQGKFFEVNFFSKYLENRSYAFQFSLSKAIYDYY